MPLRFAANFFSACIRLLGQRWIGKHGSRPSSEWIRLLTPYSDNDAEQLAAHLISRIKPNDRGEVWPPELADVIHLLRPQTSLPDSERAYKSACASDWIHPAVYEAAQRVGTFELRTQPESRTRHPFQQAYQQVCDEFMSGNTESWRKSEPVLAVTDNRRPAHVEEFLKTHGDVRPGDFGAIKRLMA